MQYLQENAIKTLRNTCPLVHQITNYVTVNDCANMTLAIGASPIMADAIEEAGEIASIASAVVLNIGTLNSRTLAAMIAAGTAAQARGIPLVLDPVGAGASELRNTATERLLDSVRPTIIRGNLSEIAFIAGENGAAKGVDVSEADRAKDPASIALRAAKKYQCVVVVTGAKDFVTDGTRTAAIENGHPMMASITGTGCMATAVIGAFAGACRDPFLAATSAITAMGICGEHAFNAAGEKGTGSFKTALIDAMSTLTDTVLTSEGRVYDDTNAHEL